MKRPGEIAGNLTRKALSAATCPARKSLAETLEAWSLDISASIPLGGANSHLEVTSFSVRLKQASLTNKND